MLDNIIFSEQQQVLDDFLKVRKFTENICEPLEIEDFCLQSMPETSPAKWHLAHTSWFFETFLLIPYLSSYKPFHDQFEYLFNSYYNSVGKQYPRPLRGLQSRPTLNQIMEYRHYVDEHIPNLLLHEVLNHSDIIQRMILGCHHEQQHQELLLTDLLHGLSFNPLFPAYHKPQIIKQIETAFAWQNFEGGEITAGVSDDETSFHFDNETPSHHAIIPDFKISKRLITNREYVSFIKDGGYTNPLLWLSDGWSFIQQHGILSPLYWSEDEQGERYEYSLCGRQPLDLNQPVVHISYYEADAFARWHGSRLATEYEWERASKTLPIQGNFVDSAMMRPTSPQSELSVNQLFGDCWEWTSSGYQPYPGFKSAEGAIGEYNGKFMCNQYVLRGGSCVTSKNHIRTTYRNFFYPQARWQFSGIRLASDQ